MPRKKGKKQRGLKGLFQSAFSDVNSRYFILVNDFFAILTIISILVIVLETVDSLDKYKEIFLIFEYISVFFFSLEYIARIIAAKKPGKYIFSFFGIIDIVAILPTILGIANLTFLKSARLLRILRFLRMIRLAKVLRMKRKRDDLEEHTHQSLFSLTAQIYLLTLGSVLLVSGTLIWLFEGHREIFSNIPLAMIWSMKVLLGGVPQVMPQTIAGELITIFTRFMGLVLFSLLISIVGGSVKRVLLGPDEAVIKVGRRRKTRKKKK